MFFHFSWHPSLRLRILAPAALVAIPAIALLLYISFDRRQQAEHALTQNAAHLTSLKALHRERVVEGTRQLLIAASESRDVREGDSKACSAYLRRVVPQSGTMYTNLGVLDATGTLICSGFNAESVSPAHRSDFERARASKTFVTSEDAFFLPLRNDAGEVDRVAFATVGLEPLNQEVVSDDWLHANWAMYRSLLAFGLVACLIIVGVMAASNRLLLYPIAQLTRASRRLAAGDLGARVAASTTVPELHELGKDFDEMATALEEREKERLLGEMERKELEQNYHQAQKMDAVGRLAGGIAHDFNNMLTAILGYCELLLDDPTIAESHRGDILEIEKAGKTAAQLTRQLLAFSRREIIEPVVLDMNAIVSAVDKMLHRLVGAHIDMVATLADDLHAVKADRGQIEQVILNLALNARDAMPDGGCISIETANVHLSDGVASPYLTAPSGDYVMLAVKDTGSGMTPDVLQHLFEPFFTTKGTGKGTGLGLATIYGIVKQSNGGIVVESAVGQGSIFRIYFPRCDDQVAAEAPGRVVERPAVGTATILIVEDDEGIRELTTKILSRSGYKVLVAGGGDEAREICERYEGAIDVLLSDVVMPGMNGPMVAEMLTRMRPGMKVLFMSGYTDNAIVRHGVMGRDLPFLQKPFTPERLANKIVEVLG